MSMIIYVVLSALTIQGTTAACKTGWENYKDKCYYFSDDQLNWRDAVTNCQSKGGRLAELKDYDHNYFIKHYLDFKYLFHTEQTKHSVYIGLSDLEQTGVWKWEGSGENVGYTDWTDGEPSGGTEHCAVLWGYMDYWWNDESCDKQYEYVCESNSDGSAAATHYPIQGTSPSPVTSVPLPTSDTGTGSCPAGWEAFHQKCFLFSQNEKSWLDAVQYCKSVGGRLAEVKDLETNEYLKHYLNMEYLFHDEQTKHNFYIGLSDLQQTGVWKWEGSGDNVVYTDWTDGEPSGGPEHCAVLWGFIGYWWNDENCQNPFQYICEINKTTSSIIVG